MDYILSYMGLVQTSAGLLVSTWPTESQITYFSHISKYCAHQVLDVPETEDAR